MKLFQNIVGELVFSTSETYVDISRWGNPLTNTLIIVYPDVKITEEITFYNPSNVDWTIKVDNTESLYINQNQVPILVPSKTGIVLKYIEADRNYIQQSSANSGGSAVWGGILGTFTNQTDAINYIDSHDTTTYNNAVSTSNAYTDAQIASINIPPPFVTVNTYADLPAANLHSGERYIVSTATGTWILGTKRDSGFYYSDGSSWIKDNNVQYYLKDSIFAIIDDLDSTKGVQFNVSGLTTGNIRIKTIQDTNGTLAELADLTPLAPKDSPIFTGVVTTPNITVSSVTASTPAYFDSSKSLVSLTSQFWGTYVQTFTSKTTLVDVDTIAIFDSADTFNTKKTTLTDFWTNYLKPKTDSSYWIRGGNTLTAETIFGGTSGAFGLDIRTNNLTALKILSSPASATNYLTIQSATTANPAILGVDGSTNVGIIIQAKGAESIYLKNTGAGNTLKLKWYDSLGNQYRDLISEIGTSNGVGIATGFTTVNTVSNFNLGNNAIFRSANNVLKIVGSSSTTSSVGVVFGTNSANFGTFAPTTGTHYLINMWSETNNSFAPTSGNANMRMIDLSAFSINQTGTATGNVSLINLNPTVTSVTGSLYSIKSSLLSGTNIYNLYIDGTAINYLNGNTSIKTTTSTAFLTIGGGTVANSALRLIAGSMPTGGNILDGNINYDGSNLRLTVNTTDFTLVKALTGSAVLDFPSIAASGFQDLTVTVTGASIGDIVSIGEDNSVVGSNIFYKGFISAANTVTIRAFNTHPSNAYDPTSATFKIIVQKI